MKISLTDQEKQALEKRHRTERDSRVSDRIKAVLLKSEGWSNKAIAQALRIHIDTVGEHLSEWLEEKKLKPENGGSSSKLNEIQRQKLDTHLKASCYTKVIDICHYVFKTFHIEYTISGMTKWLQANGFRYKRPKALPAKLDVSKQEAFIEAYFNLVEQTTANEPIVFMDAVHPTMATKISYGWIKKGINKPIAQTAYRTRVNVIGAIELKDIKVHSAFVENVNSETTLKFFGHLKAAYPHASKIHVTLDQAGYNRSQDLQKQATLQGIELHYLPPYSPNLNPIERLWMVMNEQIRNNVFFESANAFRKSIAHFFDETVHQIRDILRSRINDNFQVIYPVSSS